MSMSTWVNFNLKWQAVQLTIHSRVDTLDELENCIVEIELYACNTVHFLKIFNNFFKLFFSKYLHGRFHID